MPAPDSRLSPQPWQWVGPRVLVEHPDADAAADVVAALRRSGFAVAVCPGPADGGLCPLATEDGCAAAEGADVVVSALGLGTPETRAALSALRRRLPETPLLVTATAAEAERWPELVYGAALVDPSAPAEQVLDGVRALRPEVGEAREHA